MLVAQMPKSKFLVVLTTAHSINYVYIMFVAQMPKSKFLVVLTTAHNINHVMLFCSLNSQNIFANAKLQ